ncbi:PAS domain S-box-containing protein [Pedobacter cryoconitis]|uniref:PAS domain S-box-containing protein n=1 Tax=Pedobacter cryoconitis TaxID=188932 RepID=A0A7W8YR93_9SPHI|nr:PAS domain S-box protein [Pedobacter cryoconitis]MBB5620366.1 PAS domain S-box-containing protein [Pedobacter cryoconitis]
MDNLALISILNNAIDGIITVDFIGKIESANPAACKIFGYTPEEAIGKNISEFMPSTNKLECLSYRQRYLPRIIPEITGITFQVNGLRKDGTIFPFQLATSKFENRGRKVFTCFIHELGTQKPENKIRADHQYYSGPDRI